MNPLIEFFLVLVIAGLVTLPASPIGLEFIFLELSWKKTGILFFVLAAIFEVLYFVVVK